MYSANGGDRSPMAISDAERLPPHNTDAEMAVLGSILIDPDAIYDVMTFLQPEHFYRVSHAWLYEVMITLASTSRPIDFVTVAEALRAANRLDEIGEAGLVTLMNVVPTSVNCEHYGRIVAGLAHRRRLIHAAGQAAASAWDESVPVEQAVEGAERAILSATAETGTDRIVTPIGRGLMELYDRTLDHRERGGGMVGIPTGFLDLDRILGGLKRSEMIVVAGRPSMGKTTFGLSMLLHMTQAQGRRVAFYSLEMSTEQLLRRLVAMESGIEYGALETAALDNAAWTRFGRAVGSLSELGVFVDDTAGLSVTSLLTRARRLHIEHGLDALIVDYLGLLDADRQYQNDNAKVGAISNWLKRIAKELDIPVIALAQLNRSVENRADKRPQLSDLRDSGSVEQDSDVVMFLYRDDYYNPDTSELPNQMEVIVAKHRNGPTGRASLYLDKALMRIRNLAVDKVGYN